MYRSVGPRALVVGWFAGLLFATGCTSPSQYIHNGFKVGPNTCVPQGPVAAQWIDEADIRVVKDYADVGQWWTVFQDPTLDWLIANASSQNLSLREAGFRVLQARSQLGIVSGNLFPQSQQAFGGYQHIAASQAAGTAPGFDTQFFDQWGAGFNLSWELDFWGRFRRAVTAAEHSLDASCNDYSQALVTLLGDVATNYVQVRTLQQRIAYLQANVGLQEKVLQVAERRLKAGSKGALDFHQAQSNLTQTQAQIPQLEAEIRLACNRLCVLLSIPPTDLERELGTAPIPTAPKEIAIGIPAELLRRRPDVRRAERQAAAQGEEIGMAEADLYPMFSINGILAYQSEQLPDLFTSAALNSSIGPTFQWNILNYGRIRNNICLQDARFGELITAYQQTVLQANAEAEDGLAIFLKAQERASLLDATVASSRQAVEIVSKEYQSGAADFNRVALIQLNLVQQQNLQAQAHGEIAMGLIQVYRALGGGWEVSPMAMAAGPVAEPVPQPAPPVPEEIETSAESEAPVVSEPEVEVAVAIEEGSPT